MWRLVVETSVPSTGRARTRNVMGEIAETSPSTLGFPDSDPHPVTSPQGVLEHLFLDQLPLGVPMAKRVQKSDVRVAGDYFGCFSWPLATYFPVTRTLRSRSA